jgi:hypothetical protein
MIIQTSDLKAALEELFKQTSNSTTVSIGTVDYYPSINFKLVKKAVYFFFKEPGLEDQVKIKESWDMIKGALSSILLRFIDNCYKYDGDKNPEVKGLTIDGYESVWLADPIRAYTG